MSLQADILVACESSGRVRDALISHGYNAVSCDLLPSESPGPHIQDDVRNWLQHPWKMVIAHPPCTRLCNSGVRWLAERNLWDDMRQGAEFFLLCLKANAPLVAVENPIMHKYARAIIGRGPDFYVQPYDFGDWETKRTGFWTKNLPPLLPTIMKGQACIQQSVHHATPSTERHTERSRTFPGIANAIAIQWGPFANA